MASAEPAILKELGVEDLYGFLGVDSTASEKAVSESPVRPNPQCLGHIIDKIIYYLSMAISTICYRSPKDTERRHYSTILTRTLVMK